MSDVQPIEWREPSTGTGARGYVGNVLMFTVTWGLVRKRDTPWEVRTTLPGFRSDLRATSLDEAKVLCGHILRRHVQRITAQPAPSASIPTAEETTQ